MYKIKLDKTKLMFGLVFTIFGTLMSVTFIGVTINDEEFKNTLDESVKASYIVENCDYDSENNYLCSPIYYYEVDMLTYSCNTKVGMSKNLIDFSKDTVLYNSNNPAECMTQIDSDDFVGNILVFVTLIFPLVGILCLVSFFKKIKKAKILSTRGILVKGLPYTLANSNVSVNGVYKKMIIVDYQLPNGALTFNSRPINNKELNNHTTADLLYDPQDYSNFYVDFNIERKY